MSVHGDLDAFAVALPAEGVLAGLDLGTKTIGIALSDTRQSVASPHHTIRRRKFTLDAQELLEMLALRRVEGIVLGLPLNMDGSEGPRCQSTRAFARNLSRLTDLPIGFWDERLSSFAAEQMLIEAGTRRARRDEVIDKVAASIILQGFLDRLAEMRR
ncbi:Holliday junction resolvase RuvX [Pararhodobacter sp. SW119]|uniref:Holliday junction resolvase RuvX n=1 Tax=Pararhodobacter sp. SW119 TaxID=2780075 RepID=UPI001AE01107